MERIALGSRERLTEYLVDGEARQPMEADLAGMLAGSPRFLAFALANREKIRKKLRTAVGEDALRDVRAELRVAQLLLEDPRMELAFEEGGATGGPDFTIRHRGGRSIGCEVTRMRRPPTEVRDARPVLAKIRQLRPSVPNVVIVAIDGRRADELDVANGVLRLRRRADAKDEGFFVHHGFTGTRDFYGRFLRLAAVIAWCEHADEGARTHCWTNRSARIAVPERTLRAIVAAVGNVDR